MIGIIIYYKNHHVDKHKLDNAQCKHEEYKKLHDISFQYCILSRREP